MRFYARTSPNTGASVGLPGAVFTLLMLPLVFVGIVLLVALEAVARAAVWVVREVRSA